MLQFMIITVTETGEISLTCTTVEIHDITAALVTFLFTQLNKTTSYRGVRLDLLSK